MRLMLLVFSAVLALTLAPRAGHADWRTQTGVFRIGIAAGGDGLVGPDRFEPFRAAVAEAIAMPVEVLVLRNAPGLIDAQAAGRIDYAVLSALGYAAAQESCACLVPLAAPRATNGAAGVRSVLVVDPRRGDELAALREGPVGYGPAGSLTGDLAPSVAFTIDGAALRQAGLDLVRQPSFEAARAAFASGELAGLFAWEYAGADGGLSPVDEGLAGALVRGSGAVAVWRSQMVPFGPHAVREDVPDEIRQALREVLINLNARAPDAYDAVSPSLGGGFASVAHEDYEFATAIVQALAAGRTGR